MQSEQKAIIVKPNYYFENYYDMLSFLNIEEKEVDKLFVYFKRRGGTFEKSEMRNLSSKYNFPPNCQLLKKDRTDKLYKFDYSKLE